MNTGRASKRRRVSHEHHDQAIEITPSKSRNVNDQAAKTAGDDHVEENEEDEQETAVRASGRQRRKPKRYESDDGNTIILQTPTKVKRQASTKKSSARGEAVTTPASAKRSKPPRKVSQKDTEDANNVQEGADLTEAVAKSESNGLVEETLAAAPSQSTSLQHKPEQVEDIWEVPIEPTKKASATNGIPREGLVDAGEEEEKTPVKWPGDAAQHTKIRGAVLEKIVGKRPANLVGVEEEYKKLHQVVEQTVVAGEGNSLLLIGARGTGKTALIQSVIHSVSKENREQFHVIRLNGFIQTDDRLALREIWRQLGKEMETEDENQVKNYADTLSTLLATLSHSSELTSAQDGEERIAKSVVFILDEFDFFAAHPRQTLLYNLFDIAQSRKAPIAVIGVTTRVDIAESLEKRVKSRFSHRYIHLTLPKTLSNFQDIYRKTLQLQMSELHFNERAMFIPTKGGKTHHDVLGVWNTSVEDLFRSPTFTRFVSQTFYTTKSIPEVLTASYLPMAMLTSSEPFLTSSSFSFENALTAPDSKLYLLPSLSTLALALLIAAARLDVILDSDLCNFNMAYDEYSSLAARARISASASMGGVGIGGKVWGKEAAKEAWEKLMDLKLLMPTTALGGTGSNGNDMMRCEIALEEIEGAVGNLDRGLEKWCKEI